MGTGYKQDAAQLRLGMACIIYVDPANSPQGFWWGTVVEVIEHGTHLDVKARITGGPVAFEGFTPVKSDLNQGCSPTLNYTVIPDTEAIRMLLHKLLSLKAARAALEATIQARTAMLQEVVNLLADKITTDVKIALAAKAPE